MSHQEHIATILVATDLSREGENVVEWAGRIAVSHGARVVVHHGLIDLESHPASAGRRPAAEPYQTREDAVARLDEIVERLRDRGLAAEGDLRTEVGPGSILSRAAHFGADLIVAGTHASTRGRRVLLGSTATRLIRDAPVPVLVVPPSSRSTSRSVDGGIHTILVPTDLNLDLQKTIEAVELLLGPGAKGASATLLYVHESSYQPASPWRAPLALAPRGARRASATRRLEALAGSLEHGLRAIETVTCGGDAARAIEREAQYRDADLIVMSHGRATSSHLLRTSTIERVLATGPCPVLAIRSRVVAADRPAERASLRRLDGSERVRNQAVHS